ncbi:MAG: hypothetical protein J5662_01375, partial [Clostridia bacterium]|nr:hypothetical protein [Clostridia bacterium]
MDIFVTLCLIFLSLSAVLSLYLQYQMLQQSSYFISRYYVWLKGAYVFRLCFEAFLYCILSLLFLKQKLLLSLILSECVLALRTAVLIKVKRTAIKPLAFTGRI